MVKVETVKEAKKQRKACFFIGSVFLCALGLSVIVQNTPLAVFFGTACLLMLGKMRYWELVLRLDKSLK